MKNTPERWGIIGGGILGMTLAYRLAQKGFKITLFEAAPHLGGLASAWRLGDIIWDRHYHVTLLSDTYLRNILAEIELEKDIEWVETKTGFFSNGQLYSMSNTVEFLKFPPLGFIDKLRLGSNIFYASKIKNWKQLEKFLVEDWLRKWSGNNTFEKIWLPLLRAKLGDTYTDASAAFIWATIQRMYAARRTGLKKEMFGYVPGGYATILECFAQKLKEMGVEICTQYAAKRITPSTNSTISVEFHNDSKEELSNLILTIPSPIITTICTDLDEDEVRKLNNIQYLGVVCASLLLKKPLSPFYVTNITDSGLPFTGVIEMSALVDKDKYLGGNHLVYLPKYVTPNDRIFSLSDEEIENSFFTSLQKMYQHLTKDDIVAFRISRARYVFALSTLNYSDNLPPIKTSLPGLHIINSAHIVNGTLNVNETIQLAERALTQIIN